MLRFRSYVDWQHVDPVLLQKLNALGAQKNKIIEVFSGYRNDKYSAAHGGFAGDPHTRHIAVDANIDGKPIGLTITPAEFAAVGLITGNQPNFYKGKTDPAHVQLGSGGSGSTRVPPAPPAKGKRGSTPEAPVAAPDVTREQTGVATSTLPSPGTQALPSTQADVFSTQPYQPAPGSGINSTNPFVAELWNRIASQPGSSSDTQLLAQNAQLTGD